MAKLNLEIKGVDKLLKDLGELSEDAVKLIDLETLDAAQNIELAAKNRVPVDTGRLRGSITTQKITEGFYRIFTNVRYAPYMEFGTGRLTSVPNELKDLAIRFKGKGIKEVNILPRPFMWPSFIEERPKYIERLRKLLKKLTNAI